MKYALRQLKRSPGVAVAAILSVGIGIGATAAIFTVVDAVLVRPLPYPDADRLVRVDGVFTRLPLISTETGIELAAPVQAPELEQSAAFASIGSYAVAGVNLSSDDPQRLRAAAVTPGFFTALAVRPVAGRTFSDDDLKQTDRVAVISFRIWRRRFGADPSAVGRSIELNGRRFVIAGVMPKDVEFPEASDIWIPRTSDPQIATQVAVPGFVARLAPGVTREAARQEALRLTDAQAITRHDAGSSVLRVTPLREAIVGDIRPVLMLVSAAAVLVLFVACLNTANLLLARISAREREFAVRRAMGATTSRLAAQVLCECLLLATASGLAAIPIAFATLAAVRAFVPLAIDVGGAIAIDHRTLTGIGALSLAAAGLFGLAPSISAQSRAATALRAGSSITEDKLWRRVRSALVVVQIAVAVAILVGASAIIRTIGALNAVDLGARNGGALVMQLTLPRAAYPSTDRIRQFYDRLRDELARVPGVELAGATSHLPGSSTIITPSPPITLEGRPLPAAAATRNALRLSATPGYFPALGIDVLAGRAFNEDDGRGTKQAAIVSESYARAFGLRSADIVGRRVNVGIGRPRWAEIVGVVRDVRMRGPESDLQAALYVPFAQSPINATGFVAVKTRGRPQALISAVRSAAARVDRSVPLYNVQTFEHVRSEYLATRRFAMTTMVSFGSVAFGLAAVGLYGVISYLVRLRTREIAIRIAIGAPPALVRRRVMGSASLHAASGIGIGLALTVGLWKVVSANVPGIGHLDSTTLAILCAVVFVISTTAAWVPARRAARIDPLVALRAE